MYRKNFKHNLVLSQNGSSLTFWLSLDQKNLPDKRHPKMTSKNGPVNFVSLFGLKKKNLVCPYVPKLGVPNLVCPYAQRKIEINFNCIDL